MPKRPDGWYKGRKCHICGSNDTAKSYGGNPLWYKYYEDGKWDGTSYMCTGCHAKIQYRNLDGSYIALCRIGQLDKFGHYGAGIIGQWIVANALDLKDLNIENDNFLQPIDLSKHSIYGRPDVKTIALQYGYWSLVLDRYNFSFDTIIIVCMNKYRNDIERIYVIPKSVIIDKRSITITKSPSRGIQWYDKYRIDERHYNDIYNTVDIPRFFSPFDLWNGMYSKKL